ncbi:hypothetical protein M6B38_272035 [Iris pallida]|uniref:Uncharacterized protein n=1 Tax=Iris pallida TaxID=29817 RepID=A0AAX6I904_IRIPA|nr:hypothetical protein M6B38_272035 [Iris pallida]
MAMVINVPIGNKAAPADSLRGFYHDAQRRRWWKSSPQQRLDDLLRGSSMAMARLHFSGNDDGDWVDYLWQSTVACRVPPMVSGDVS